MKAGLFINIYAFLLVIHNHEDRLADPVWNGNARYLRNQETVPPSYTPSYRAYRLVA